MIVLYVFYLYGTFFGVFRVVVNTSVRYVHEILPDAFIPYAQSTCPPKNFSVDHRLNHWYKITFCSWPELVDRFTPRSISQTYCDVMCLVEPNLIYLIEADCS